MAMVTQSSLSKKEENPKNHREASFSFYLNSAEESFVLKLAESSPIITAAQEHPYMTRKKAQDREIGVFGAERYFNGAMDEESPRIVNRCASMYQDEDSTKPKTQLGTPSVHSESSWNSQSALLQSVLRNPSRKKTNKVHGKSFLANLGCKCSCADKNSVDIDEDTSCGEVLGKAIINEPIKTNLNPVELVQVGKPRSESEVVKEEMKFQESDKLEIELNKENCFTFPIINSGAVNMPAEMLFHDEEDEKPRKSLIVFGSPMYEKRNKSLSLDKRLSMLSWDATPKADDTESDASSDLFEIESLTGKAVWQASDGPSECVTPTTCYAPSEASIEWSIATVSAADFSVMSDSEEQRPATIVTTPSKMVGTTTAAKNTSSKDISKRRPSIMLGCKSHKAVRVAGDAYRTNEKANFEPRMPRRPESFTPVTRFQAEMKLTGFGSRQGQRAFTTCPISQSESAHASQLLYIQ